MVNAALAAGYGSVTGQGGAVVAADAILEAERGLGKGCVGWAAFGHLVAAGCLLKINFYPNRSSTGSPGLTWSENPSGPKRVAGGTPSPWNSVAPKFSGITGLSLT